MRTYQPDRTESPRPSISALTVEGYKSIAREQRIAVRPLTLLSGINSSGKSSMLQPALLLKQTLDTEYNPSGALLLDGANVRFTKSEQLLSSVGRRRASFTVGVQIGDRYSVEVTYRRSQLGFEAARMLVREDGWTARFTPRMSANELSNLMRQYSSEVPSRRQVSETEASDWVVSSDRSFLAPMLPSREEDATDQGRWMVPYRLKSVDMLVAAIRELIHVPAWRGTLRRDYPTTGLSQPFRGTFDHYVASVIARWQTEGDARLNQLTNDLAALGLTWRVEARPLDETRIEVLVGRLPKPGSSGSRDLVSIADVGFGVAQSLPVVTSFLAANPDQLVYVEEPEINLHPRAQVVLAGLAVAAARRGVRVVLETHSSLLLRAVQTAVAKREIHATDVALHWFSRSETTGATRVTTADLQDDGSFGGWPVDFDDVTLAAEREYLDAG